jgi:hypothetical protein
VDAGRKLTVNIDSVEFNQIPKTCKSQQIWKPSAIQKRILQISTDLKVVRELGILEDQCHTTPTHERRQTQTPQHQLITSLPPRPHLQTFNTNAIKFNQIQRYLQISTDLETISDSKGESCKSQQI